MLVGRLFERLQPAAVARQEFHLDFGGQGLTVDRGGAHQILRVDSGLNHGRAGDDQPEMFGGNGRQLLAVDEPSADGNQHQRRGGQTDGPIGGPRKGRSGDRARLDQRLRGGGLGRQTRRLSSSVLRLSE